MQAIIFSYNIHLKEETLRHCSITNVVSDENTENELMNTFNALDCSIRVHKEPFYENISK